MLVVADTSPLVALAACNELNLLEHLFHELRVPRAVLRECIVPGKREAQALESYLRGKVTEVDLAEYIIAAPGLGRGELEAMALYRRLQADLLLVDDQRARKVARLNGIDVVGSLGVLLQSKNAGLVSELRPLLVTIRAAGLHYSEALIGEALRLAGEQ